VGRFEGGQDKGEVRSPHDYPDNASPNKEKSGYQGRRIPIYYASCSKGNPPETAGSQKSGRPTVRDMDKDQMFFPLLSIWMDRDGLHAPLPARFLRSPQLIVDPGGKCIC